MPVPEAIRKIPRPVNTVVVDNGKDSPLRYAVRARLRTKYVRGGNPQPRNGRVIGHITDGRFVPLQTGAGVQEKSLLSCGASALVNAVSEDVYARLCSLYTAAEAPAVMVLAALRVLSPAAAAGSLSRLYRHSWLSCFYPGAELDAAAVHTLLQKLGEDEEKRRRFCQKCCAAALGHVLTPALRPVPEQHAAQDFYHFPPQAQAGQRRPGAALYAFDAETLEPVLFEVFPDGSPGARQTEKFLNREELSQSRIFLHPEFPEGMLRPDPDRQPSVYALKTLKKKQLRSLCQEPGAWEVLDGRNIRYKMLPLKDGSFACLFRDPLRAEEAQTLFLAAHQGKKALSREEFAEKQALFGVSGCSCECSLPPQALWQCLHEYELRELVLRCCAPPAPQDQDETAAAGSEFVSFIAAITAGRIIRKTAAAGLLEHCSLGELLDRLAAVWRRADAPWPPCSNDSFWLNHGELSMAELEALGLAEPAPAPEARKSKTPRR